MRLSLMITVESVIFRYIYYKPGTKVTFFTVTLPIQQMIIT